jgi:hypothetical protein
MIKFMKGSVNRVSTKERDPLGNKNNLTGGAYYTHTHTYIETWGNQILIHIYTYGH